MKFIKSIFFTTLLLASAYSFAQPYKTALGLRLGYPAWVNFNVKHNFGPHWSIEGAVGGNYRYIGLDVAGEYNFDIKSVEGMRWYLGASVDVGAQWWVGSGYYYAHNYYAGGAYFSLGTSIFGGLEYTFPSIPLNLSVDLGPRLPILPNIGFLNQWVRAGTSVRYTFK